MDGIEMMCVLRERGSTAHVIVLTAYNDFDYARSALRFGAADYLLKPFRDQELVAAIERVREKAEAFSSRSAQDDLLALPKGDKSKYVLQTLEYIAAHYADADINITTIARSIGISEGHLSHVFKKETRLHRARLTSRSTASTWRAGSPTAATRSTRSPAWSATAMSPTSARPSKSSPVSPPLRSIRTAAGRTRKLHKKYGTYRTSSADFHSISQKCPHNRRLVPFRAGAANPPAPLARSPATPSASIPTPTPPSAPPGSFREAKDAGFTISIDDNSVISGDTAAIQAANENKDGDILFGLNETRWSQVVDGVYENLKLVDWTPTWAGEVGEYACPARPTASSSRTF